MVNKSPKRIINAVAPIRICDIGGWTDTWFAKEGSIFNIAIYPQCEVQIYEYSGSGQVVISPEDYGPAYTFDPDCPSRHPLLESAVRRSGFPKNSDLHINVHSGIAPGASTGTSASVTVALVGALKYLNGETINPLEIAYEAHRIETEDLHQQSGVQDQIAAAVGGINLIHMRQYPYDNQITPLILSDNLWWELEQRLCLIYLGHPHSSSNIHQEVIKKLENNNQNTQALLNPLRQAALKAAAAIKIGDFNALGQAANDNTTAQRQLFSKLISTDADRIFTIAHRYGALGTKVNGAGGDGGSITIISGPDMFKKRQMLQEIKKTLPHTQNIPILLSRPGLRVWED